MTRQSTKHQGGKSDIEIVSVLILAAYFGVSPTLIRRLVKIKKIPHVKVGRRVLFQLPVIREWLRDNTVWPGKHQSDWHRRKYDPVVELKKLMERGDKNFAE